MPPPPGDDTRDESSTGGASPEIIIAPLLSDEDVAPGQTNAASGNASEASSDPAPGPSDATTSGATAGEPAGGDGDRPRGVPWRRPIPSFFAVGPRGELMPHFLPPGVDFNNPAESGPFGNDMENMMPLAPFLDFLINRIGGQAPSRPDPEAAAELLRSLDDVKSPMFRRVNRVIVAEQAQEGLEQDEDEKGWKCGICLEGIEDDVKEIGIKGLPCNHLFHESCLRPWFETKHTCPTCRLDLDPMKTLRHPQRPAATRPPPTGANRTAQHPYARDGPRPSNRPAANTENADNPSGNTGTPPAAGPPADQPSISFFWRMPNPAPSTNGTFSAPAPSRNAAEAAPEDTGSTTPPGEPSQSSVRAEQTPSGNDAAPPAPSTAGAQGASTSARNSDGNTRNPAPPHRGPQITVIHTGGGPPHLPGMPGFPTPPTFRPPGTAQSGGVPWPLSFPLPPFPRPPAGSTPPVSSEAATDPIGNTSATTTTNSADAEGSRDAGNASTGRAIPTSNNDSTPESENQRSRSTNSDNGQALAEAPDTESRPTPHFHFIFNFTGGHEGGPPGIPSVGIPPPREAGARADSEPPPLIPAQTEGVEPPAPERAPERAPARAPERESLETWVSKREKVLGWRCDAPICQLAPGNDDGEDDFNFDDIEPREKQLLSINSPLQPGPNASTGSAEDDESEPASKKRKFEIHGCEHRWHRQCIETSERAAARPLKVDGEGRVWVKCEKCRKDGWVMPRAERSRSNSEFEVERLVAEGRV